MATDTLPADTLRLAVIKALLKLMDTAEKDGKKDLKDVMDVLEIESLAAKLPDGTKVATVNRAGGNTSAKVTDEGAFLRWVIAHRPGEVVQAVRESYQDALLKGIDKAGPGAVGKDGRPVDPESGEFVDGVEFVTGKDWLTVLFKPGGEDAIKQAWRSGRLSLDAMLALPEAGGESGG